MLKWRQVSLLFSSALVSLAQANILNKKMIDTLKKCGDYLVLLAPSLAKLLHSNLLTEENFDFLAKNDEYSDPLSSILINLSEAKLCTKDNLLLLVQKTGNIKYLDHGVSVFCKEKTLTQASLDLLFAKPVFAIFANELVALSRANILTSDNARILYERDDPHIKNISDALSKLGNAGKLTENNFRLVALDSKYSYYITETIMDESLSEDEIIKKIIAFPLLNKNIYNDDLNLLIFEIVKYARDLKTNSNPDTSFIDLTVKEKHIRLESLFEKLYKASSLNDLNNILISFYNGKSVPGSDYEILNAGQGVATRMFKLSTSSIKKVDALKAKVDELLAKKSSTPGFR